MKKFVSILLSLTIISGLTTSMTAFAATTGRTTYFCENVIEGHTTNDTSASKDLFVYRDTDSTTARVTVTAVSATSSTVYDAEVVDVADVAETYPNVARGAVGKKLIKYTQSGDYGMLRLQNWIPSRTYKAGETVKIGMRVYMTDTTASQLETRLTFCNGGSQLTSTGWPNSQPTTATNQWVLMTSSVTLTADQATTLTNGNVGMRFDFINNATAGASQPYAGTVFYDDVFFLEVTESSSEELVTDKVIEGHTTNDVSASKDLSIYKNNTNGTAGQVTVTALNHNNTIDYDAQTVNVGDIEAAYPEVAKGAKGRKLIKYTQDAGIGMLRLQNWIPSRTYTAGEVVKISMRVFLTDTYANTAATTTSDVDKLKTRLIFCVGTTNKDTITSNKMEEIATNKWVTVTREVTLTEDYASILNGGNVGMRFDFAGQSGNTEGITDKAYAGTVFFDDAFSLEVVGNYAPEFTSWAQNIDNTGSITLQKGGAAANGQMVLTTIGTPTAIDGYAFPDASFKMTTVADVKDSYPAVAEGHIDADRVIKVTQNGSMVMTRMTNAVAQGTFKEGEVVEISINVLLADPKNSPKDSDVDNTIETVTGRFALRNGNSDVAWDDEQIPVGEWTTVTKRFRITSDQTAVHGFRFDFKGSASAASGFDRAFAGTIFFDGEWSLKKVDNIHNTSEHSQTVNTEDNTVAVSFKGTNVSSNATRAIVAAFDVNDILLGTKEIKIANGTTTYNDTISVEDAAQVDNVKLFLINDSLSPLQKVSTLGE